MEIAPGIQASEWLALRLEEADSPDWGKAVSIFEARIRARYLEPVDILLKLDEDRPPTSRRFGFTILAIDCLLVETLQSFRLGLTDTRWKSKEMFRQFLTQRPRFQKYFDVKRAEDFYENVRCGILHLAELRGGWRVWSVGRMIEALASGWRVNRSAFHQAMVGEFEDYMLALANVKAIDLRGNFRHKMEYICTKT